MKPATRAEQPEKNKRESGFTLIEMSMVMVIMGIVISIMMTVMPSLLKTGKIKEARAILQKYDLALQGYAIANSRLPGASPIAQPNLGNENPALSFGYLPYRTLGLSNGNDVWGYPVWYAVYNNLTNPADYCDFCTKLRNAQGSFFSTFVYTIDENNQTTNQAYVIISNGPKDLDGNGSMLLDRANGTATVGNPGFNADNITQAIDYDDLVRSFPFTRLMEIMKCPPLAAPCP